MNNRRDLLCLLWKDGGRNFTQSFILPTYHPRPFQPSSLCSFHRDLILRYFTIIIALSLLLGSRGVADEKLRIVGMGGVKIGVYAPDAGIFGNPAALLGVAENNLSISASVENYRYDKPPGTTGSQFFATLNFDSQPSVYYSRSFGDFGVSVGYTGMFDGFAEIEVEPTRSEYIIDQRSFSATTNMVTDYALLWESGWSIGFSRRLKDSLVGFRLKRVSQTSKRGQILSGVSLRAEHGSDVNINDPRALIPAIINSLDLDDPAQYFDSVDAPSQDLTVRGFELDLGYQREETLRNRPLRAGLIVENLFQRKLIEPLPLKLGVGIAHEPFDWMTLGFDISRVFGHRGLDFAIGGELHESWTRGFKGATALRGGISRIDATGMFSVGITFTLGSLHSGYTLKKRFTGQPFGEATHLFASTVRF